MTEEEKKKFENENMSIENKTVDLINSIVHDYIIYQRNIWRHKTKRQRFIKIITKKDKEKDEMIYELSDIMHNIDGIFDSVRQKWCIDHYSKYTKDLLEKIFPQINKDQELIKIINQLAELAKDCASIMERKTKKTVRLEKT